MELLNIQQIEKYYGSKSSLTKAIDDISFSVAQGICAHLSGFRKLKKHRKPFAFRIGAKNGQVSKYIVTEIIGKGIKNYAIIIV